MLGKRWLLTVLCPLVGPASWVPKTVDAVYPCAGYGPQVY